MITLSINTNERLDIIDITDLINEEIKKSAINNAVATIFIPHTTAAITINENGDPDVLFDLKKQINKLVPFDDNYKHFEGNSQSHVLSSIIGVSVNVIIEYGRLHLGRWQSIYFIELDGPRTRDINIAISPTV